MLGEFEKSIIITDFIYLHDIFNKKHEFVPAGTICIHAGKFYMHTDTCCTLYSTQGNKS